MSLCAGSQILFWRPAVGSWVYCGCESSLGFRAPELAAVLLDKKWVVKARQKLAPTKAVSGHASPLTSTPAARSLVPLGQYIIQPYFTMGREDQKEEREVLDSIFPDEITGIADHSHYSSRVFVFLIPLTIFRCARHIRHRVPDIDNSRR